MLKALKIDLWNVVGLLVCLLMFIAGVILIHDEPFEYAKTAGILLIIWSARDSTMKSK